MCWIFGDPQGLSAKVSKSGFMTAGTWYFVFLLGSHLSWLVWMYSVRRVLPHTPYLADISENLSPPRHRLCLVSFCFNSVFRCLPISPGLHLYRLCCYAPIPDSGSRLCGSHEHTCVYVVETAIRRCVQMSWSLRILLLC